MERSKCHWGASFWGASCREDNLTKLNDTSGALKYIELYARIMLVKHPKFHPVRSIELQQMHAVFALGVFKGYTFQYTIDDRDDFEIFVAQNAHTNIFSDSIKQFDIGFTIYTRDTVFIDRSRTFLDPVLVTVLFERRSKTNEDISLVMKGPSGNHAEMFLRKNNVQMRHRKNELR
ncbi:unnamed protein product [Rotaria magnacalcarata]